MRVLKSSMPYRLFYRLLDIIHFAVYHGFPVKKTDFRKLRSPPVNQKERHERNRRFRIARAFAGITQREFARRLRVDDSAISKVLSGASRSARIEQAMQRLIDRHYPKQAA